MRYLTASATAVHPNTGLPATVLEGVGEVSVGAASVAAAALPGAPKGASVATIIAAMTRAVIRPKLRLVIDARPPFFPVYMRWRRPFPSGRTHPIAVLYRPHRSPGLGRRSPRTAATRRLPIGDERQDYRVSDAVGATTHHCSAMIRPFWGEEVDPVLADIDVASGTLIIQAAIAAVVAAPLLLGARPPPLMREFRGDWMWTSSSVLPKRRGRPASRRRTASRCRSSARAACRTDTARRQEEEGRALLVGVTKQAAMRLGAALDRELVHRRTLGQVSLPCLTNPGNDT